MRPSIKTEIIVDALYREVKQLCSTQLNFYCNHKLYTTESILALSLAAPTYIYFSVYFHSEITLARPPSTIVHPNIAPFESLFPTS